MASRLALRRFSISSGISRARSARIACLVDAPSALQSALVSSEEAALHPLYPTFCFSPFPSSSSSADTCLSSLLTYFTLPDS